MKYVLLLFVAFTLSSYVMPAGWVKSGTKQADYDMGTDIGAGMAGENVSTIKSTKPHIAGNGSMVQNMAPGTHLGKRVKMTAYMKAANVVNKACMWMRVDGNVAKNEVFAFDNMQNRPVTGTKNWTKYEIVLDVPNEATNIAFGATLENTGQVWFQNVQFEDVTYNVPTTDYTNR